MNRYLVLIFILFISFACSDFHKKTEKNIYLTYEKLSSKQKEIMDSIQYRSFLYFLNESNIENGMVKDRSTKDSPSTIAASGFSLPVFAIGVEKGWMSREDAAKRTLNLLKFLMSSEQSDNPDATGYKGFYYHFLNMKSGEREWKCELSSIDSGLLFAGIIFARQYFDKEEPTEKEIWNLSEKILSRIEWEFFVLPDTGKYGSSISMGWHPESGFNPMGWTGFNEALILYVIAAGTGMADVEKAYDKWLSHYQWIEPYKGYEHTAFPPLFGHQYSHMFVDFRGIADKYMTEKGIDYFENSRIASYVQRLYAIQNPKGWKGYDSLTWGITACDGPGPSFNFDDKEFWGYAGRGTSGPDWNYFDDGTIAPTAAVASVPFAPEITIPTLIHFYDFYGPKGLWGKYGFLDSFNPTLNWFNTDYLGIDQGPIVVMIENYKTGLVWNQFMEDSVVIEGLKKLGFNKLSISNK